MNKYCLVIVDEKARSVLSKNDKFRKILSDGLIIWALDEPAARQKAYKQCPMCDIYAIEPGVQAKEEVVLGLYPQLWLDDKLTTITRLD